MTNELLKANCIGTAAKYTAGDTIYDAGSVSGTGAPDVDLDGNATYDIDYNPNGSTLAIEGIISPDGRVIGKMGHSERVGKGLYKNVMVPNLKHNVHQQVSEKTNCDIFI